MRNLLVTLTIAVLALSLIAQVNQDTLNFRQVAPTANRFWLEQNTPNPVQNTTTFGFSVPEPCHVEIVLYNSLGQQRAVVLDDNFSQGSYAVDFDCSAFEDGVYIYTMRSGNKFIQTRKLLLIKP